MSVLKVENIRAGYNRTEVLKEVSLEIEESSGLISVIGNNGAGKTTLLRAIIGILPLNSGSIFFQGKDISALSVKERIKLGISCVPEGRQVFPLMSVFENLQMGGHIQKDKNVIKKNLDRVYSYFPILKEKSKQLGNSLSGGQQQMLAIGRALMLNPSLLLMDEPSMGLAPLVVEELGRLMTHLHETERMHVMLLEQNAQLAFDVASYVYVLEVGRCVMAGESSLLSKDSRIKEAYLGL
jgi:branched-chain amino acid transport system ATP-binding protein